MAAYDESPLKGPAHSRNNIWIAATATFHDLALVTRDQHIGDVEELVVVAW